MNLPGIAGLRAGVEFVARRGVVALGRHRSRLVARLRAGLADLPNGRLSPLVDQDGRAGIVSVAVDDWRPEEVGQVLRESFDIEVRAGLHCAPRVHAGIGTAPSGNVRISVGDWNTEQEIDALVAALQTIVASCAV